MQAPNAEFGGDHWGRRLSALWLAASLTLAAGCAAARQSVPPTLPHGRSVMQDYEASFNAGWEQVDSFEQSHWVQQALEPAEDRHRQYEVKRKRVGNIEVHSVDLTNEGIVALVRTELGDWVKCFIDFGADGERVLKIKWLEAKAPESEPGPRTQDEFVSALDDFVSRFTKLAGFSGAVLIARRGEIILEKAYGQARRQPPVANQLNTRFNTASIDKLLTAVVVFELIEAGKLSLDGTVCQYLPKYPLEQACPVTIDQLLTHTAGMPDIINPRLVSSVTRLRSPQDYIDLFGKDLLVGPAGGQWRYSNYGYAVLGRIVEVVEGQPFDEVVRKRVYDRAIMRDSLRTLPARNEPNVAVPYAFALPGNEKLEYGVERDARPYLPLPGPFCCSYTTVHDLYNFAQALIRGKLVSRKTLELMVTTNRSRGSNLIGHYGYGIMSETVHGVDFFGHDGGLWGVNGVLRMTMRGDVVVVLSNVSPGAAQRVGARALDWLARLPAPTGESTAASDSASLATDAPDRRSSLANRASSQLL